MKLELKHLAPYLPYNLPLYRQNKQGEWKVIHMNNGNIMLPIEKPEICKPILRPFSDLVRDDIKEFNFLKPILELVEMEIEYKDILEIISPPKTDYRYQVKFTRPNTKNIFTFSIGKHHNINLYNNQSLIAMYGRLNIELKLFEWHFDVFDLLKNGLAINLNTINQNA